MSLNEENDAPPLGVCSCKPTCTAHSSLIHGQAAAEILRGERTGYGVGVEHQAGVGSGLDVAGCVPGGWHQGQF